MSTETSSVAEITIADIFDRYEARLMRFAKSLAQDTDQADDLVQETLIKAMLNLELLNRLNEFQRRAWLYRVLKNKFLDQHRASQRMNKLIGTLADQDLDHETRSLRPDIIFILDSVPGQYRGILEKKYVLGMTSAEIGKELGLPASTVRSRLRLAAQWMRKHKSEFI